MFIEVFINLVRKGLPVLRFHFVVVIDFPFFPFVSGGSMRGDSCVPFGY